MKTVDTHKATSKTKPAGSVRCAFCDGTGMDPLELLPRLSKCPVCNGRKTLEMEGPTVVCAYCRGTGKQRHVRLACSGCGGAGVIPLPGPTAQCPQCGGSGREPEADLPCSLCKGAGLVTKRITHENEELVTAEDREEEVMKNQNK